MPEELTPNQKRIDELQQERLKEAAADLEFVECDACRKKPGTPLLCQGCLINRQTISHLHAKLKVIELREDLYAAQQTLNSYVPEENSGDYANAKGYTTAIYDAKQAYRELYPGGCKLLGKGNDCNCFLCQLDNLQTQAQEIIQANE